jgi:hypothetical protein
VGKAEFRRTSAEGLALDATSGGNFPVEARLGITPPAVIAKAIFSPNAACLPGFQRTRKPLVTQAGVMS